MEPISATFMTFGLIMLLCSWVMLIIHSFKSDYSWGLCSVFLPALAYIYACFDWKGSQDTIWMAVGGWALLILSWII